MRNLSGKSEIFSVRFENFLTTPQIWKRIDAADEDGETDADDDDDGDGDGGGGDDNDDDNDDDDDDDDVDDDDYDDYDDDDDDDNDEVEEEEKFCAYGHHIGHACMHVCINHRYVCLSFFVCLHARMYVRI